MGETVLPFLAIITPNSEFVWSIILALVTASLLRVFQPKVKLVWGSTSISSHRFKLREDGEPVNIATEKLYVQNVGRKSANNVELVLSDIPTSYTLWTPREHTNAALNGGGFVIKIPSIAPGELLIIDTIDVDVRNPRLLAVNCPDVLAKWVEFLPQRQFGKLFNSVVFYLFFSGFVGTAYLLLTLLV